MWRMAHIDGDSSLMSKSFANAAKRWCQKRHCWPTVRHLLQASLTTGANLQVR